jgi:hypothetical protein
VLDEVAFVTKPQLGIAMLGRTHAAGVLTGWVTADEVYGQHRGLRDWLAAHQVPFVLATRSHDALPLPGRRRRLARLATTTPTPSPNLPLPPPRPSTPISAVSVLDPRDGGC